MSTIMSDARRREVTMLRGAVSATALRLAMPPRDLAREAELTRRGSDLAQAFLRQDRQAVAATAKDSEHG